MRPLSTPDFSRRFDRSRRLVQALFEQRVFGRGQQALADLGDAGARNRIAGIAGLCLKIQFQRVVAGGFGQPIGRERSRALISSGDSAAATRGVRALCEAPSGNSPLWFIATMTAAITANAPIAPPIHNPILTGFWRWTGTLVAVRCAARR